MTDRPTVTDAARAEAARRWGGRRTSDRLSMDWLDEGMASGFVLGAQWAAARAETTADLHWSNAAAAEGWDQCVKSLRYEDGSPVEIVEVTNPYRKMLEGLDAKETA